MANYALTALLLLALAAGAQAADVDLGGDCSTSGSTCVHPTLLLTCDSVTQLCVIQAGQTCTGVGHGTHCVSGATCSSTCTCESPRFTAASGKCTVSDTKWGAACVAGTTDCTTGIGVDTCPASLFCKCEATKYVTLSSGECAVVATDVKIGRVCTTGTEATDCGAVASTFMKCATSAPLVCTCEPGYSGAIGDATCVAIAAAKVGHICTSGGSECGTGTNLQCASNAPLVCECATGYTGVSGGDCYPALGKLGGGCSSACTTTNSACTGTTVKKCTCGAGYQADTAGTACVLTPNAFGGSCTGGPSLQGTCTDTNGECSASTAGTCGCKTGYQGAIGVTCAAPNVFGGSCTGGPSLQGTCTDTNGECSLPTAGTCGCKTGYQGAVGSTCAAANEFGGSCTGGPSAKGTCTDTNGECSLLSAGTCGCKTGYVGKVGEMCAAGAGSLAASLTLLLAAILGRLTLT